MDVLVLGGTVFLGRAVATEALAAGADVTIFNRGLSGEPPEGVEQVTGDRTERADLEQLAGRHFDLVVDTSGYVPAEVALSTAIVDADHYAFVSTINVYPGWPEDADYRERGVYDGGPDATAGDAPAGDAAYGWLKSGCERAVLRAFEQATILRAGLIVGPHDDRVGRLPWWLARVARGGDVLVPGAPDDELRVIDARDLARFALAHPAGTFDLSGPPFSRRELMHACREVTGGDARFTYIDGAWLAAQEVEPWTEVPLWAPGAPSAFAAHTAAAEQAGLRTRPLHDTLADTWAWQQALPGGWRPAELTPGLAPGKEAALLAAFRAAHDTAGTGTRT